MRPKAPLRPSAAASLEGAMPAAAFTMSVFVPWLSLLTLHLKINVDGPSTCTSQILNLYVAWDIFKGKMRISKANLEVIKNYMDDA